MRQKAKRTALSWQRIQQGGLALLKQSLKSTHSRIVTCGILIGFVFLPTWFSGIGNLVMTGSPDLFIYAGFIGLAAQKLFGDRRSIAATRASEPDRMLGYMLILGGAAAFTLFITVVPAQAMLFRLILVGIALANWGTGFLRKYAGSVLLILVSAYPDFRDFLAAIGKTLMPNQLESFMAWAAGLTFNAVGQPAVSQAQYLALSTWLDPKRAVEVAYGCTGFDMAVTLAGVGLILGLFLKQTWLKTVGLMLIGVLFALVINIPRIILLAVAIVYWGEESFKFWHGTIGGQILSSIILTGYYYLAMALVEKASAKKVSV